LVVGVPAQHPELIVERAWLGEYRVEGLLRRLGRRRLLGGHHLLRRTDERQDVRAMGRGGTQTDVGVGEENHGHRPVPVLPPP